MGTYLGLRIWIKSDVNHICQSAITQYNKIDKIDALISVLKSDSQNLEAKNKAIWALEHLKHSERALPVLKALQSGAPCNHSWFVCQRELSRTIDYLEEGKLNLMKFN